MTIRNLTHIIEGGRLNRGDLVAAATKSELAAIAGKSRRQITRWLLEDGVHVVELSRQKVLVDPAEALLCLASRIELSRVKERAARIRSANNVDRELGQEEMAALLRYRAPRIGFGPVAEGLPFARKLWDECPARARAMPFVCRSRDLFAWLRGEA